MNGNAELLNFIYQNSQMGVQMLEKLLNITEDSRFHKQLSTQLSEYQEICREAKDLLNQNHCDEKDISGLDKLTAYLMINIKTLTDKSPSHVAEMLIHGSNMGITDATRNIHKYEDADSDILNLMKKLLKIEENNVKALKEYL